MGSPIRLWVLDSHAGKEPTSSWLDPRDGRPPTPEPVRRGRGRPKEAPTRRAGLRASHQPGGLNGERWVDAGHYLFEPTVCPPHPQELAGSPDTPGRRQSAVT